MASEKKKARPEIEVAAQIPEEGIASLLGTFRRFSIGKGKARRDFHLAMRVPVDRRNLKAVRLEKIEGTDDGKSRCYRGVISPAEFVLTSQASSSSGQQIGPPVVVEFALGRVSDFYRVAEWDPDAFDYSGLEDEYEFLWVRYEPIRFVDGKRTYVQIRDTALDWAKIRDEAIRLAGVEIKEDRLARKSVIVRYDALRLNELTSRGLKANLSLREQILALFDELGGWEVRESSEKYGEIGRIKKEIADAIPGVAIKTIEKYVKEAEEAGLAPSRSKVKGSPTKGKKK